jgi:hypothetical protein
MHDDEILRLYLLGSLDEEQADDLERRLLLEKDLFERAEAVEGDLLMSAARGELSPEEHGRVLRRLASSPEGRARYAIIQGLTSSVHQPAEAVVLRMLSRPRTLAAAMAACLVLMTGVAWLTSRTMQPGPDTGATIARPLEPEPTSPSPEPAVPPVDQIAEHAPVPAPPVSPKDHARPEPGPWIIQLALSTTRGPGERDPLAIPRGTLRVEIRLPLLPDEPFTSFAAILRNASTGDEIRREEGLAAKDVDGQKMVVLSVPAADLTPGTYEVEVRKNEEDELLGLPTFEIASN